MTSYNRSPSKVQEIGSASKPLIRKALFNSGRTLTAASLTSLPQLQSQVERITVNVGGQKYQIPKKNLEAYPDTLLSSDRKMYFYDRERQEFFFDRDPVLFKYIVEYYRTGQFHLADNVCPEAIGDEMAFYGIPTEHVSDCCCDGICFDEQAGQDYYDSDEKEFSHYLGKRLFGVTIYETSRRAKLYKFLTDPSYSLSSAVYNYILAVMIILNICTINAETIDCEEGKKCVELNQTLFFVLDSFCVAIFTFEYFARLYAVDDRWKYVKEFSNVLDLIGILPYYVSILAWITKANDKALESFLTVLRVVRVSRITKLARHSARFRNLLKSLKDAAKELGGILFSFLIIMLTFSTLAYEFEKGSPCDSPCQNFTSIPAAFWYTIVTMTTLGYGDMVPVTVWGKLLGSCCALIGVLLLALPVPIIEEKINKFNCDKPKRNKRQVEMTRELAATLDHCHGTQPEVSIEMGTIRLTTAGRCSEASSSSDSYHSSLADVSKATTH